VNKRDLDVYLLAAQQYRSDRRSLITEQDNWEVGPHGFAYRVGSILGADMPPDSEMAAVGKRLIELGFFLNYHDRSRDGFYTLTAKALPS
jgi:hypothetical protein